MPRERCRFDELALSATISTPSLSPIFVFSCAGYNNFPCPSGGEGSALAIADQAVAQPMSALSVGDSGMQCPPCAEAAIDTSVLGVDDELLAMSKKAFACNAQKAMEDLTTLRHNTELLTTKHNGAKQDRDRFASFGVKLMKAQEEENAFRFCVKAMMPDLLEYWDRKAKEGKLPTWTEAEERKKDRASGISGGITNDVLIKTAMELDPAAQREAEQANKMQSGLKTMMDKMAMGSNGKLTDDQLAQLKALHEQLGSHLYGDQALPLKTAGAGGGKK